MVVVIRTFAVALAAFVYAAGSTAFAQDMNGKWNGRIEMSVYGSEFDQDYPDYLAVELVEQDGRVFGEGIINRCAACASFDDFAVRWEGTREGDRLSLRGVYTERTFEVPLILTGRISENGEIIEGDLTNERRQFREKWRIERAHRQVGD